MLNGERINYWLSVGAQPSDKVSVLIKKYGAGGTHLAAQQQAIGRLAVARRRPEPMAPLPRPPKPAKQSDEGQAPAKGRRRPRPPKRPPRRLLPRRLPPRRPCKSEPAATERDKVDRRQCDSTF